MEKLFAVSVADAYIRDKKSDTLVVKGKALLSSAMEQAVQESEVFAGRGSKLQFVFNYQKVLSFQVEAADFAPTYLALQTGSTIQQQMSQYFTDEKVTFDASGVGTLKETPIGSVYAEVGNTHQTFYPTGNTITIPSLAGESTRIAYQHTVTVDVLTIPANSFPGTYELTLTSDLFNSDGEKAYEMQIEVPRYKLDGALSLALTHDGVSQFTLNGKALVDDDDNYAYIKYIPQKVNAVKVNTIVATPANVTLDVTNTSDTEQISVRGIRGGVYGNVLIDNSSLTFTSSDTSAATVDATGLITINPTAIIGDTTIIKIVDADGNADNVIVDIA